MLTYRNSISDQERVHPLNMKWSSMLRLVVKQVCYTIVLRKIG